MYRYIGMGVHVRIYKYLHIYVYVYKDKIAMFHTEDPREELLKSDTLIYTRSISGSLHSMLSPSSSESGISTGIRC